jgi:hypothetical protein
MLRLLVKADEWKELQKKEKAIIDKLTGTEQQLWIALFEVKELQGGGLLEWFNRRETRPLCILPNCHILPTLFNTFSLSSLDRYVVDREKEPMKSQSVRRWITGEKIIVPAAFTAFTGSPGDQTKHEKS